MLTRIALKHTRSILIDEVSNPVEGVNPPALTFMNNMMSLGFIPSENLSTYINRLGLEELTALANDLIPELQRLKGADVKYKPMYPNFPQQVMEMSYCELFMNAIIHYWSFGQWLPDYDEIPREFAFENTKFKTIDAITEKEFFGIFDKLLSSNESISDFDRKAIQWLFTESGLTYSYQGEVPFKENLCFLAAIILEKGGSIAQFVSTATDVLRICTALSGGDISLAENTKFKSFPRPQRRIFVEALNAVIREEDIARHRGKWIRLFHSLHIGEYSGKAAKVANKIRSGGKINTFNGQVEAAISQGNVESALELLRQRPGDFARRMDHMIRLSGRDYESVLKSFYDVVDRVPTRILLGILGNLKVRAAGFEKRVVFPKGAIARATVLRKPIPALAEEIVEKFRYMTTDALARRFKSKLEPLGKVWIDPYLTNCPLPVAQRSASEGLIQVARGTRLPIGDDKNTLRFFIYWIGRDIDLSATMHDENFENMGHISYTRLKSSKFQAYHSGDITSAPSGAAEFIDVTMDGALESGVRYVAMNVLVFSGPTFKEHEKVYAGWMTRQHPQSNEIFDPKTVENKIDLASETKNSVPVIFDLKERVAIWADLTTSMKLGRAQRVDFGGGITAMTGGNNVEANRASIGEALEAMLTLDNKITLAELFSIHADARGEIVSNREDAETIFSMDEGITPYDIATINSEYVI